MYRLLHFLNLPVDVQEVCVFTAPLFSALTALSAYALASEVRGRGPGLVAASLAAVVPSYVSRSVAGSYDNEGVAIFALVTVFWLYVKTLKVRAERERGWEKGRTRKARAGRAREKRKRKRTGPFSHLVLSRSLSDPTTAATANTKNTKNADGLPRLGRGALAVLPLHGGVVGGYTFIINLLPIHCLACVLSGRLTPRLYVAYAPLVAIGTLEAASIPVVGFNAVLMSEHFGSFLAFAVLHAALAGRAAKYLLPPRVFDAALRLGVAAGACCGAAAVAAVVGYVAASPTFGWTGRSLSLVSDFFSLEKFHFFPLFLFFSRKKTFKKISKKPIYFISSTRPTPPSTSRSSPPCPSTSPRPGAPTSPTCTLPRCSRRRASSLAS